ERIVFRQWLAVEDVQGSDDPACGQRLEEGGPVDEPGTRGIDDHGTLAEKAEVAPPDDPARCIREDEVQADNVRVTEEVALGEEAHAGGASPLGGEVRAPGGDLHAEGAAVAG